MEGVFISGTPPLGERHTPSRAHSPTLGFAVCPIHPFVLQLRWADPITYPCDMECVPTAAVSNQPNLPSLPIAGQCRQSTEDYATLTRHAELV